MRSAIEALLYVVGEEGLTIAQLSALLNAPQEAVQAEIGALQTAYEDGDRGIHLVSLGAHIALVTKPELAPVVSRLAHVPRRMPLSQAAIETLAVIIAKQPITRVEIEHLRGVGCEKALRKLLDKQLIEEAGRMDVIGRPVLYRTTQALLRHLHIASLDDLPSWEQLEHADDD
ncbi:MAG: SMC-Scp complex subunit ScpB [Paenibacillaceae bacterium]|nr:SMC-Scp complex subunit ScpB [Paenibacillaceae bacterium]